VYAPVSSLDGLVSLWHPLAGRYSTDLQSKTALTPLSSLSFILITHIVDLISLTFQLDSLTQTRQPGLHVLYRPQHRHQRQVIHQQSYRAIISINKSSDTTKSIQCSLSSLKPLLLLSPSLQPWARSTPPTLSLLLPLPVVKS
jgi:hypothetical protein